MKIKVVLCSGNKKYIGRLLEYYEIHHEQLDKYDLHLFSDSQLAKEFLSDNGADVLLVEEKSQIDLLEYPRAIGAYLVDDNSIDQLNETKAIGKYQKAENLFNSIFSLYAEKSEKRGKIYTLSSDNAKVYLFQNVAGGSGNSTVAMAFAICHAQAGKKVLYLNLELAGNIDGILQADGEDDFGDILYVVKKNSGNLAMKLIASTVQDQTGVYFIKPSKNVPNLLEMDEKDMELLLSTLKQECDYDIVVVDRPAGLSEYDRIARTHASRMIFVLEATEMSQKKYLRYISGLKLLEPDYSTDIMPRIAVLFNQFEDTQAISREIAEEIVGGIPVIKNMNTLDLVYEVSQMKLLRNI